MRLDEMQLLVFGFMVLQKDPGIFSNSNSTLENSSEGSSCYYSRPLPFSCSSWLSGSDYFSLIIVLESLFALIILVDFFYAEGGSIIMIPLEWLGNFDLSFGVALMGPWPIS